MGEEMNIYYALMAAAAGGTGGFGGAFAAIKVHIQYINRHQDRQDKEIARVEAKVDVANQRIDSLAVFR